MKAILAMILLAGFCAAESVFFLEIPEGLETTIGSGSENHTLDFLTGFLEGLGETGDVNKLMKCAKNMESIFKTILEALNDLKHMTIKEVVRGLKKLVSALKDLLSMLKPCMSGFKKLEKLIDAVSHANIMKIATHIIAHPTKFLEAITNAIRGFTTQEYHKAGKGVGLLLAVVFLGRELSQTTNAIEILKGLLQGIGETKDVEPLLKCIKDAEKIFQKIIEALEYIMKKTPHDIITGIKILVEALEGLRDMLKPCMEGYSVLEKLMEIIKHPNLDKIALNILNNLFPIINSISRALYAFHEKDYYNAGKHTGEVLKFTFIGDGQVVKDSKLYIPSESVIGFGNYSDVNKIMNDIIEAMSEILDRTPNEAKQRNTRVWDT